MGLGERKITEKAEYKSQQGQVSNAVKQMKASTGKKNRKSWIRTLSDRGPGRI
jgi:hypothetical protein